MTETITTKIDLKARILLRALEVELREIIKSNILPHFIIKHGNAKDLIKNGRLLEGALNAYKKKKPNENYSLQLTDSKITDLEFLIDQTTFPAAFDVCLNHKDKIPNNVRIFLTKYYGETQLAQRLRIIEGHVYQSEEHEGSILNDDLDFLQRLVEETPKDHFPRTHKELKNLDKSTEDFSYLDKQGDWDEGFTHNVPYPPEHTHTGFLGREKEIKDFSKRLKGNTRIISIIGSAGVGKTALAQKLAIDFIKAKEPFDMVLWYSFKNYTLTTQGITEIENLQSIEEIVYKNLDDIDGYEENLSDFGEYEPEDFFEWIQDHNPLIVLDNLETIQGHETRKFIEELQEYSKVLITARSGLDIPAFPSRIGPLTKQESINLFKRHSKVRNVDKISIKDDKTLGLWGEKLYYNPLWIKSFCNLVAEGKDPNLLISELARRTDFADYSFQTNYEALTPEAKNILIILFNTIGGDYVSKIDLHTIYSDSFHEILEPQLMLAYINQLVHLGFLDWNSWIKDEIILSGLAKEWLYKKREITSELRRVLKSKTRISGKIQALKKESTNLPVTDWQHFDPKNREEQLASHQLNQAMGLVIKSNRAQYHGQLNIKEGGIYPGYVKSKEYWGFIITLHNSKGQRGYLNNYNISEELLDGIEQGENINVEIKSVEKNKKGPWKRIVLSYKEKHDDNSLHNKEDTIDEAVGQCESILSFQPGYFEIERVLGLIKNSSARMELKRKADDHFLRAIELAPKEAKNYYFYSKYLGNKDLKSHDYMIKANELDPNDHTIAAAYGRDIYDPDERIEFFLEKLNSVVPGSREAFMISQSLFRSVARSARFEESRETPMQSINRYKDLMSKMNNRFNANYFDSKAMCYFASFLIQYIIDARASKLAGNTDPFSYFLTYINEIDLDITRYPPLQKHFIMIYDQLEAYFPDLSEQYKKIPFINLQIPTDELTNRISGRMIKKYTDNKTIIIDEEENQYYFKITEINDSLTRKYYFDRNVNFRVKFQKKNLEEAINITVLSFIP